MNRLGSNPYIFVFFYCQVSGRFQLIFFDFILDLQRLWGFMAIKMSVRKILCARNAAGESVFTIPAGGLSGKSLAIILPAISTSTRDLRP